MKPGRRRCRFTGMSFAVLATVITGFAPTYYLKPLCATPALPLIHIHGALFSAWVLLFAAQTSLVAANRTEFHKRLGIGGAVLAVAMVVSGSRGRSRIGASRAPGAGRARGRAASVRARDSAGQRRGVHDSHRAWALLPPTGGHARTAHAVRTIALLPPALDGCGC